MESKQNKWIKYIRKLSRRRFRDREGKFVLEGMRAVEEGLDAGRAEAVLFSPRAGSSSRGERLLAAAEEAGVLRVEVSDNILQEISDTGTSQGILGIMDRREFSLPEILAKSPSLLVLVDGVQDPGNLGTIIRAAAGAGAAGLVLLPGTVDAYSSKTLRATMGNIFRVPVLTTGRDNALKALKDAGLVFVVGNPRARRAVFQVDLTVPVVIVAGNETRGPREDIDRLPGWSVSIPMTDGVDSLNVAMATGIILYEVIRQRNK